MAEVEMPFGDEAERALKNFNKRALGAMAPHFQKGLATATEPLFRCNMGQRYFTSGSLGMGVALWLAAAGLGSWGGGLLGTKVAVALGLLVAATFAYLGMVERKRALQRQFSGAPRHSLSRGERRIQDSGFEVMARLAGALGLLALAPPAGGLFIASQVFCAFLVSKQEEAIMSRYLDALDQKIEGEFLQDALLGKCPPEVTYLYKPLPETLNPELRANIAAAAAGKPVKIVAQAPTAAPNPTGTAAQFPSAISPSASGPEPRLSPETIALMKETLSPESVPILLEAFKGGSLKSASEAVFRRSLLELQRRIRAGEQIASLKFLPNGAIEAIKG